jgi:hypothetical protein
MAGSSTDVFAPLTRGFAVPETPGRPPIPKSQWVRTANGVHWVGSPVLVYLWSVAHEVDGPHWHMVYYDLHSGIATRVEALVVNRVILGPMSPPQMPPQRQQPHEQQQQLLRTTYWAPRDHASGGPRQ